MSTRIRTGSGSRRSENSGTGGEKTVAVEKVWKKQGARTPRQLARIARANRMAADAELRKAQAAADAELLTEPDAAADLRKEIRDSRALVRGDVAELRADAMAELLDIGETVKAMDKEWQREAERTEERLAEIQRELDAILREIRRPGGK